MTKPTCPTCKGPAYVVWGYNENAKWVRTCRNCSTEIPIRRRHSAKRDRLNQIMQDLLASS